MNCFLCLTRGSFSYEGKTKVEMGMREGERRQTIVFFKKKKLSLYKEDATKALTISSLKLFLNLGN
jgi:hypothetical protein